jgi:hypothetical protein
MFSYISPEQRIPANHPLRLIRALVLEALKDLSRSLGKFYWRDGLPSISPEQLLSALSRRMCRRTSALGRTAA